MAGGDVTPGKAYVVAEKRPEVFIPRSAGTIIPCVERHGRRDEDESRKRNVFLDSVTVNLLRDFLAGGQSGRLFQSRLGTPPENRDICRRVLTPNCKKLAIKPGGMHAFRHGRSEPHASEHDARRLREKPDRPFQSENHEQLHAL